MDMDPDVQERLQQITERVTPAPADEEVTFEGFDLHIARGVFNPARGRSTRKMLNAMRLIPLTEGERVLEIGTGCGVLSLFAWQATKTLPVAVDIAPEALACARTNFNRYHMPVEPRPSDLFSGLNPERDRFDVVIFNAPTAHPGIGQDNPALGTVWDATCSLKQRFAEQVGGYLTPTGRAYMMYAVYRDYDSLSSISFTGYDVHKLFVERDALSESGVIVMARSPQPKP